jgi:hypothetical protein
VQLKKRHLLTKCICYKTVGNVTPVAENMGCCAYRNTVQTLLHRRQPVTTLEEAQCDLMFGSC